MKALMAGTAAAALFTLIGYGIGYSHRSIVEKSVSISPIEAMLREVKKDFDEGRADQARRKINKLYDLISAYSHSGGISPEKFYHEVINE